MARVTYGSGITELAGSIGGVTYQKNASGNIAKLRSNPTVNPTSRQAGYQTYLAYLVSSWSTLSQANKDLWDTFAVDHLHTTPWGESKKLSGYQWFLSTELIRHRAYDVFEPAPPSWVAYSPPDVFTLAATVDHLRCEWAAPYSLNVHLLVYLSLPLRQSSLKLRRSTFYVTYNITPDPISTLDLTTFFEDLTGVTWANFFNNSNAHVICRLRQGHISKGLVSSYTSAIVKID